MDMKKLINFLDTKLGRLIFRNDNNFLINLYGSFKRFFLLKNSNKKNNFFSSGYEVSGQGNLEHCLELKSHINAFVKKNFDKSFYNYTIPNNKKIIEICRKLFESNKVLKSSLKNIFNNKYIISNISIYRNYHFDDSHLFNEQYSNFYHCDHYLKTMFKVFIILDNVNEQNGPLYFFDKKTTKKIIPRYYKNRNNYASDLDKKFQAIKFTGKIGDTLICSTTECLHKAGVPEQNNTRDIIVYNLFNLQENNPWHYEKDLSHDLSKKLGKINI